MLVHFPRITTDGLVLCLDAGNSLSYTSGDSVWKDLSGNGYDATLSGTYEYDNSAFPSILFNNQNELDGSGRGIINFGNSLSVSDNTIECVFKINRYKTFSSVTDMQTSLFTSGRHSGCAYARHLGTYRNGANGFIDNNLAFWYVAGEIDGGSGPTIYINTIYFLTLTFQTNLIKYYINGNLVYTDTRETSQFSFNGNWAIANSKCLSQDLGVDVNFYSLKVYNRALSEQETNQNYLAIKGRYGL